MAGETLDLAVRVALLTQRVEELDRLIRNVDQLGDQAEQSSRQVDQLGNELDEAGDEAGGFSGKLDKLKAGLAAVLGALAVGEVAAFTADTFKAAEETLLWSERLGITVERLSALEKAAAKYNLEADQFRDGLSTLSERIVEFSQGQGEAKEAFDLLGVSAVDVQGKLKSTDRVLQELAQAFARTENAETKLFAALSIFGDEAGRKFINPLNDGREALAALAEEARRTGAVLTTEQAQAAKEASDNIDKMNGAVVRLGQELAIKFAPAIAQATGEIAELVSQTDDAVRRLLGLERDLEGILSLEEVKRGNELLRETIADLQGHIERTTAELQKLEEAGRGSGRAAQVHRDRLVELQTVLDNQLRTLQATTLQQAALAQAETEVAEQAKNTGAALGLAGAAAEKYTNDLAELNRLLEAGRISHGTYEQSVARLAETQNRNAEEVKKAQEEELARVKALGDALEAERLAAEEAARAKIQASAAAAEAAQEEARARKESADAAERTARELARSEQVARDLARVEVFDTRAAQNARALIEQLQAGGDAIANNVNLYEQLITRAEELIERNRTSNEIQDKFGGQTLDRLRSALDDVKRKVEDINDETESANRKFEELTRRLEQSIAARQAERQGRFEEFRAEQRFQETLRQIEEENAAFSRQQREELRKLAERDHQDELRRIEERKRAERAGGTTTTSTGSGGGGGFNGQRSGGGIAGGGITVNVHGLGEKQAIDKIIGEIDRRARLSR